MDSRIQAYARILVDCIDPRPEWQVSVRSQPPARPLIEEISRELARRGARALVRLGLDPYGSSFLRHASMELITTPSQIELHEIQNIDSYMVVLAPENTRASADIPAERLSARQAALREPHLPFLTDEKPWVGCYYPTTAAAQDAGLPLPAFEDFLYGAVLIDWEELRVKMEGIAEHFDRAETVRIVGAETDLSFGLSGRRGLVDALAANMPGGEIFYCPLEDTAEGVISYLEYPACYLGHEVAGVRLRFEGGKVVDASATSDEAFLLGALDSDEGARRLGEFGIGCNPGIQRHMRNTLFDEKMEGTVHLAVGTGFPQIGGVNTSGIHWDMVKELRNGGRIELDGKVVQENGVWALS